MKMEQKDEVPSNDSIQSGSIDKLQGTRKAENNVTDHNLSLPLPEETTPKSFSRLVGKVVILASLCLVSALSFGALSMIAPFYPKEAQARGVSTSVVGLIFATYPIMGFISAPICGIMIAKCGPVSVLYIGVLSGGTSLILFGFCAWISAATEFVVLSFLFRALCAFGGAACETSALSIVIEEFPERLGMASGFIQIFSGVGLSVGPVLGGSLYTVGGFPLPFFAIGCCTIASIPVLYFVFSNDQGFQSRKSLGQEDGLFPIVIKALKIPAVLLVAVCFTTTGLTEVYFEPILGPHLEKTLSLNTTQIGLVFLVFAATYSLVSPPAGWIGDKTGCYRWLSVAGFIGIGFGFFLLGPAPFLTFFLPSKKVWFMCVAMAVIGFSFGVFFVQLMPDLVEITREKGMPDNSATRGVISSIFSGMLNLGESIGPTLAGILDEHIGFQWATTVAGIISFAQAVILVVFIFLERLEDKRSKSSYSPIVSDDSDGEEKLVLDLVHEQETG